MLMPLPSCIHVVEHNTWKVSWTGPHSLRSRNIPLNLLLSTSICQLVLNVPVHHMFAALSDGAPGGCDSLVWNTSLVQHTTMTHCIQIQVLDVVFLVAPRPSIAQSACL
jgi:uncharacterized membrane protein